MPELVLIAAVARNGIIGADNDMPWALSSDLKHFKRMTLGKPMIMGRKTFLSFGGRPLPGRPHIVITRDRNYAPDGAETATSLEGALKRAGELAGQMDVDEIFCIGGGQIYTQVIEQADRLEITEVDARPDGDTRFPEIHPAVWRETRRIEGKRSEKDSADFAFVTYRRKV
ncbi:dihydrofolate reductase [Roseibium album]|uniref:Dihydrofolate reductase n=1 Tax=Roseibium album TaxID=311410 RepID=A0A0M7ANG5_9HYPH|nr:dihydrofolate reductase [Roseibium album]CTQ59707.1 Dihydrofolate reductase type 3 [Roseibium album]CTQ76071.1 Dihydrofolate reductase type 3 [Roseibium album]CTQ76616.1 Dihydrofolate reductase type 3 [Roseibium album]